MTPEDEEVYRCSAPDMAADDLVSLLETFGIADPKLVEDMKTKAKYWYMNGYGRGGLEMRDVINIKLKPTGIVVH
jgi:hypothetical protein